MKPFCIASIGAILGIIMGLYFRSMVLLVLLFSIILLLLLSTKNKIKILKTVMIFLFCFCSFGGYTSFKENQIEQINQKYHQKEVEIQAVVIAERVSKEYKDVYKIQIVQIDGKEQKFKMILNLKREKKKDILLEYGDEIHFKGIYEEPTEARNEGGFNYKQYLKTKDIIGTITIKAGEIQIMGKNKIPMIAKGIYGIRRNVIEKIRQILPKDTANLCTGLLIGEKTKLSEDIQEKFRSSNLSHLLAISGAHIAYILLGLNTISQKLKMHKRWGKILIIVLLIFFMALVGFTPSVVRSCIMVCLQLLAGILFRKSDTYQNLAISSFIILLVNPYVLLDIGFQLSFGGTIGIIFFSKRLLQSKKIEEILKKRKITRTIVEACMVTLSANLIIMPIMMYHFHHISFTFFISNLLATPILGISLILGMVFVASLFIFPLAKLLSLFLHPILQILIWIADFSSKIPFSQIVVSTPKIWQIILYYLFLNMIFFYPKNSKKRGICVMLILLLFSPYMLKIVPGNELTISFIDVGQGDSTLIQTPSHKTILIDGGGSENGSFDVGEKTLIPYLLNKGIMSVDYMIFSHFDSDHCQGLLSIIEKLQVKNAIISKQGKVSDNYVQFLKIAKEKEMEVIMVKEGDHIKVDTQCYLSILFPRQEFINTNVLNNNSIVAKFVYQPKQANEVSLLLTGDIEQIAEAQLVEQYQYANNLQATVLKVAHHRI